MFLCVSSERLFSVASYLIPEYYLLQVLSHLWFTALRMQNTTGLLIMNIFIDWSNYNITIIIINNNNSSNNNNNLNCITENVTGQVLCAGRVWPWDTERREIVPEIIRVWIIERKHIYIIVSWVRCCVNIMLKMEASKSSNLEKLKSSAVCRDRNSWHFQLIPILH